MPLLFRSYLAILFTKSATGSSFGVPGGFDFLQEDNASMNLLSDTTLSYLADRGCTAVAGGRIKKEEDLVRFFRDTFPEDGVWSDSSKAYLSALTDCLCSMDEMLYRFYRAMGNLYRRFIACYLSSAPKDDPVWKDALGKGDRLALIDPADMYPVPHKN